MALPDLLMSRRNANWIDAQGGGELKLTIRLVKMPPKLHRSEFRQTRLPGARAATRGARQRTGRRAAILAAAERIFAEAGLEGARTDEIAAAARVNKALLYYYFRSKDELFRAVLEEHLHEARRRALEILTSRASVRCKIMEYMQLHFDRIAARPYYPRLLNRLMTEGSELLEGLFREYSAPLYKKLVELIEEGVRTRELRRVDPHHTVYSLVALSVFYYSAAPIVKAVSHKDAFQRENLRLRRKEVMNFIRYGLFRDPEAPFA
jgi:TetR/AcrR family transcriptional regulator